MNIERLAFKVDIVNYEDLANHDANENLTEVNVMLPTKFRKVMRRLDRRSGNNISTNVKDNIQHNLKGKKFERRKKEGKKTRTRELNDVNTRDLEFNAQSP